MPYVAVCDPANFDVTSQTCSAPTWAEQPQSSLLPPLSIEDSALICAAIVLSWTVGYVWGQIIDAIDPS